MTLKAVREVELTKKLLTNKQTNRYVYGAKRLYNPMEV